LTHDKPKDRTAEFAKPEIILKEHFTVVGEDDANHAVPELRILADRAGFQVLAEAAEADNADDPDR
jgi:hypothetical protein